jgi:bifunctional non-homologous end joining protein LigD
MNKPLKTITRKKKSPMPRNIMPMLSTLTETPVEGDNWLYELKWDGFRALAYLNNGKVELRSRNNKDFNSKFYPVYEALRRWKVKAVIDGEIVVVNEKGIPDFEALQVWRSEADGQLAFFVFDILWYEGYDVSAAPLLERRSLLQSVIPDSEMIRYSEGFDTDPSDLFKVTAELGLEGIMAKDKQSEYRPGRRSKEWLKIKAQKHQEAVIAGYTRNENSSKKFSALILGVYEGNELVPIAPVGTGFNAEMQNTILKKLKPLETKVCPFKEVPDYNKPSRFRPNPPRAEVIWVKPKLVAEISYRTVSSDGSFRHPSFRGLREDKTAKEVRWEIPKEVHEKTEGKSALQKKLISKQVKQERKTLLNPSEKSQVRSIGGYELKFTNLDKLFWTKEKISKRDLINYYYQVAPFILPYLKDRPQTLNRFPNGISGKSFYQKDVKGKVPDWFETFPYYSEADQREKEFAIITNEASLLYIANLGCIEINPWSSRSTHPNNPDWCIIDLDPDKNPFDLVVKAAQVTRDVLEAIGVQSYCKTSGSTGLHIYIPLGTNYDYEASKEFGRTIVKVVNKELPQFTSIERLTTKREGKLYLDFLQNRPQATVAAPYSLRPKPGATVSMPLQWDEVKKGLSMCDFTIHNAISRLREKGDMFKGVLGKGINIERAMKNLEALF